ncbi:MAG TPA: ATP synthase subunit I [Burkholderiales bacterium]|nr:ATP synthase subunit I [Burkholderiales bacterium]
MPLLVEGKPLRTVLRWQLYASAASMLIAGIWVGPHGALSALLGGLINIAAGTVFGWVAAHSRKRTPAEGLLALIRAEAAKVVLIVLQLWVVLVNYKQLVLAPFFGTFILTVIFFSMAFFVRDR